MRIKRVKKIKVNCFTFKVIWDKSHNGGSFDYCKREIEIGCKSTSNEEMFMIICHELMEICACEMNVRFRRPDIGDDYLFVYDHRQHETMMNMFSGLISQFIVSN